MDDPDPGDEMWGDRETVASQRSDAFEQALDAAIAGIPSPYRERLDEVAIVVEDEPSAAQLASVGARGLLGLYQGVPRTLYGASSAPFASKVTLFRGPLTRASRTPAALAAAVRETLLHEVGHHLGISDARLQELRQSPVADRQEDHAAGD
jgi:predicted Zn-dependent protease with MMP-like domain